jgi:polyhydroxybutyrate depolymerase
MRGARTALGTALAVGLGLLALAPPAQAGGSSHGERPCVRTLPTGTSTLQVAFAGETYPVRVHVPARVGRGRELPLVLDLHGSNANGVVQSEISDLSAVADDERFIVANPTGAIAFPTTLPDGNWAWNVPGVPLTSGTFPPPDARDDVAFLTHLVDVLDAAGCVDDRRVYASGFSGGGRMASALACARPDVFAAIAPVAGLRAGRPDPADLTVPDPASCAPGDPVAVITFHGTDDFVNPYLGNADPRWGYTVELAASTWAELNDCRRGPREKQVSPSVTRLSWSRCDGRTDVVLYRVAGGGHTWPGTDVDLSPLGVTTQEIDASELLWEFFEDHRQPRHRHG